jgi:hypothetical protein
MPTPLSDNVSAILRSDSTAALGALMVIAAAHAELFAWVAAMVATPAHSLRVEPARVKSNGASPPAARKAQPLGADAHLARRRAARDRDDENLLEAMRESPKATIPAWAEAIDKSRSSTVEGLHRLRDAGLAASVEGKWKSTEPPISRQPAAKWVAPLSAAQSGAHVSP